MIPTKIVFKENKTDILYIAYRNAEDVNKKGPVREKYVFPNGTPGTLEQAMEIIEERK